MTEVNASVGLFTLKFDWFLFTRGYLSGSKVSYQRGLKFMPKCMIMLKSKSM